MKPFEQLSEQGKINRLRRELPDICGLCGLGTSWNGRQLQLQVDHIDGDRSNNVKENLRKLCPNCHSQTDTYCGRDRQATIKVLVYNKVQRPLPRRPHLRIEYRAWERLSALPEGHTFIQARKRRQILGLNGENEPLMIVDRLDEMQRLGLITWDTDERDGNLVRIHVNIQDEWPNRDEETILPKVLDAAMRDCVGLWYELQRGVLGTSINLRQKPDRQNLRRIIGSSGKEVVMQAMRRFWAFKAENRKGAGFMNFYFDFPRLLNDARDEIETKAAIKAEKRRKEQPKKEETEREYIERELATARKSGVQKSIEYWTQELEQLDAEEA